MSCWVKHRKSELSVLCLKHNFHSLAWNSKTSTNIPEIYKPAQTAPLQPALLKKQPKAKEGCKWKEMSCWVKHRESELSVMSLIHDFHSSSTKLLLLHIPNLLGEWFVPAIKLEPGHSLLLLSPARFLSDSQAVDPCSTVCTHYLHTYLRPKEMFRFDCNWSNTRSNRIFWYFDFLIHVNFCLWCWYQSLYFFMPMAGSKIWNSIFSGSTFGLWCTLKILQKVKLNCIFMGQSIFSILAIFSEQWQKWVFTRVRLEFWHSLRCCVTQMEKLWLWNFSLVSFWPQAWYKLLLKLVLNPT